MKKTWFRNICAGIVAVFLILLPDNITRIIVDVSVLAGCYYIFKLRSEREELIGYVDELLEEQAMQEDTIAAATKGARIAATESGVLEVANAWLNTLPDDSVRDFVVKFEGWDKDDWTMWVRLPFGKYKEHKAEVDFAMGRNVMKEGEVVND